MKRIILVILLVFNMSIGFCAEPTEEETAAKSLLYGNWCRFQSDFIKYHFDDNTCKIYSIKEVHDGLYLNADVYYSKGKDYKVEISKNILSNQKTMILTDNKTKNKELLVWVPWEEKD